MTIDELRVYIDIRNPASVLKENAKRCSEGYLFVDSDDGQCYLFDEDGKEIDINELTVIGNELFRNDQKLTKIVLPDSVTRIECYAFSCCGGLTNVTIPNGITSIGHSAFIYCDKLTSLVFKGKTKDEVKKMDNYPFGIEDYPFGIEDESIIKCEAQVNKSLEV